MSFTPGAYIDCPNLQDQIDNYFLEGKITLPNEQMNFLQFLTSPLNRAGYLQNQIQPRNGKLRTVELLYTPRISESDVDTTAEKSCTSTNQAGDTSTTYELDPTVGVAYDEKFVASDYINRCRDNEGWVAERIMYIMDVLDRKVATGVANQLPALKGAFASDETGVVANVKTTKTRKSGGVDLVYTALEDITYSAMNTAYPDRPVVFGYGEIHKYMKSISASCCADSGLNIADYYTQNEFVFLPDFRIKDAFGANHFVMLAPGAVQLLKYNEYGTTRNGQFDITTVDTDIYKQTVIYSPKTGLPYDLTWSWAACGDVTIQLKLAYKLVGLPNDLFPSGDRYEGVKWVNEFVISNP